MKDISLHILDILENSAKAGASIVELQFIWQECQLEILISDNGPGFPDALKNDPANPFNTTRTERNVGLGLNLLREAAEQTNGSLAIGDAISGGVCLDVVFNMDHIDAKPLGKLEETFVIAIYSWPEMAFVFSLGIGKDVVLDTRIIKNELGGVDINQPKIMAFLTQTLADGFLPLYDWVAHITPRL